MPDMDIMGPKEAMLSWTLETNAKKFKPAHPSEHTCCEEGLLVVVSCEGLQEKRQHSLLLHVLVTPCNMIYFFVYY